MNKTKIAGFAIIFKYVLSFLIGLIGSILIVKNVKLSPLTDMDNNSLIQIVQQTFPNWLQISLGLIQISLIILIFIGFIYLGKKYKNIFLVIMSWIMMLLTISNVVIDVLIYVLLPSSYMDLISIYSSLYLFFYLPIIILFGISILLLGKKVLFSKTMGILYIIGGVTLLISIGYALIFIADIFAIIIFFLTSKKSK